MPTSKDKRFEHRFKIPDFEVPFNACVARPVGKKEIAQQPKAQAALDKEWDKLVKAKAWTEDKVREWKDVASEASRKGVKAHVGRVFELCVEKGSELRADDPARKYKGRSVFQGNDVKDENWDVAIFNELGSAPATMQAGKAVDAYGLLAGNSVQQCDAEQAYIQSELGGVPTWVRLPKERWPPAWIKQGLRDPVVPLRLALYGHPDSGGYWEKHCEKHLLSQGFKPVPEWRSCYWQAELKLLLVVYVDDFKMAGPSAALAEGWSRIRKAIRTEDPLPAGKYLGCDHKISEIYVPKGVQPLHEEVVKDTADSSGTKRYNATSGDQTPSAKAVRVKGQLMTYDMKDFLSSCIDRYCELAKTSRDRLRPAETPFLDESACGLGRPQDLASPDGCTVHQG